MRRKLRLGAAGAGLSALLLLGFTDYLPDRIAEYSRKVEQVRGRKFNRAVPASELDKTELRRVLRSKLSEQLPVPAEDYFRTLASLGLIEEQPGLLDTLIDFYASQVIAFYDPQPRRFFVIRGGESAADGLEGGEGMAEGLIFSHEL